MKVVSMSFRLITLVLFGRRFEPTNVVHPQDKGEKIHRS